MNTDPLVESVDAFLRQFKSFTAHACGSKLDSLIDLDIPRAATKIPRQRFLNLRARRIRRLLQQLFRYKQEAGRTITTLRRAQIRKRLLKRMKLSASSHAFDCLDFPTFGIKAEHQTRQYRTAIDQHRT